MYNLNLPQRMLRDLWILREYAESGTIIGQVRKAVNDHIKNEIGKIGCESAELQEVVDRHEKQKKRALRQGKLS